jgi:Golgi phosphoprotein 3
MDGGGPGGEYHGLMRAAAAGPGHAAPHGAWVHDGPRRPFGMWLMELTMPEEILLLMLDDRTGRPVGLPGPAADLALASAIIMELAVLGRIDSDPDKLFLATAKPVGDALFDAVLASIAAHAPARDTRWWIEALSKEAPKHRRTLLDRLVVRGVLKPVEGRLFWVFPDRRYPKTEGASVQEVRARLRGVLLEDEIPDPRDALLIGLSRAAGLIPLILTEAEQEDPATIRRVDQIADLEEIGRSLSAATRDTYAAMLAYGGAS